MSSDADDQMRPEDWEGGEKDLEAEKQRRRNALKAHQEKAAPKSEG